MTDFAKYLPKIRRRFPQYRFSWEILTGFILDRVAQKPFWLDIGAGPNILIKEQPGAEFAVGLDIEKQAACYTDSKSAYCRAAAGNLPFAAGSFDFITSRYTFEHIENPREALAEISRVLKPGGIFIMQTTNVLNPLIIAARCIPFRIKKVILKKLFKETPSGIFRTYYNINTPRKVRLLLGNFEVNGKLRLKELILVGDILCQSKFLFTISFQLYKLLRLLKADWLMDNMILVIEKKTDK